MPIVNPTVDSLDVLAELLAWPAAEGPINRIQIERSATGGGAGYANIGSLTLVSPTLAYTLYDVNGTPASWYRWYFSNAGNTFPTVGNREYSAEVQPGDIGLCNIGDVKQRLKMLATDTNEDEMLLGFISQVSSWIRGLTGRQLSPDPASGSTTYTYDGWDSLENQRLMQIPTGIRSVSLLEVAQYTGAPFNTIPATDYFLRPTVQEREPGWPATELWMTDIPSVGNTTPSFPGAFANVRVTGTFGWASVPPEIADVALTAVVKAYQAKRTGSSDQVGANSETGQIVVSRGWLDARQWHILNRYTVKSVEII